MTVDELATVEAVRRVLAQFCVAVDEYDMEGVAAVFTSNARSTTDQVAEVHAPGEWPWSSESPAGRRSSAVPTISSGRAWSISTATARTLSRT